MPRRIGRNRDTTAGRHGDYLRWTSQRHVSCARGTARPRGSGYRLMAHQRPQAIREEKGAVECASKTFRGSGSPWPPAFTAALLSEAPPPHLQNSQV
eukprot:2363095-Prymnesium_polylepis.1